MIEAETVLAESLVERFLASVTEGRMPDVVREGEGFCEFRVQAESIGDGPGDLGDLKGVGKPAAKVVGREVAGEAREDLSFSSEAAERARVEDASSIAREGGAIRVVRLGVLAGCEFSFALYSDVLWEKEALKWRIAHPA